ncbi:ribonuclease H-like protein [Penicillium hispanicum]|uniref:ribonuclease H-like protein n=1 Tax=Penicillium hispanicum TaxID=1080232 RepID=UPI002540B998|nr:ribonuclease H-like protein [Penicillium hispanicum]KAJ5594056.1 ribonuclease H-like protein [Penicillium hispanicum]
MATNLERAELEPQVTQVANPPIILDPMEQDLILRYLQARAHSLTRLRTQGYALTTATDPTPRLSKGSVPIHEFELAPPRSTKNTQRTRRAIVIDCEMVEVANGCSELASLSAIDFLTGEVLINNYVHPTSKVVFWRTKHSGITPALMASAVAAGQALNGWPEARKRLWEFATRDTVLIGHSLNHDLDVLGILHSKVVDSSILTGEAVFPALLPTQRLTRTWGLKKLAQELLAHKIQTGKAGHDALEDAYATRNVVIWCIRNPELLKEWAEQARHQEAQHKAEKSQRKRRKARSKGKAPASKPVGSPQDLDSNSSSDPFDVAAYLVECGWPHPDTGYEPWSD